MHKLVRVSTVPESLNILLKGQLEFLSKSFEIYAVSSGGEDLLEVKARERVSVQPIQINRKISLFKDLGSLYNLYRYFKKIKPTIVHSITPKAGLLSMLAAKFAGVPIRIHTFTGLIFPSKEGYFQKLLILMDRILCWAATDIFPEGQGVKNDLEKFNITSKPLKILANGNVNGIDTEFYNPSLLDLITINNLRHSLKISSNDFVYIFIGRLVSDKGIRELISAFEKLPQKNRKLLLVGSFESSLSPLDSDTICKIKEIPNIIHVGFQKDIRPYLSIANVMVFPSYREGFPNVVLQAGAMGLPVIVTDINGSNEIIKHNFNGIIIPKKDELALLNSMEEMSQNKPLLNILKSNSRREIQAKFGQKEVWDALLKEYRLLVEAKF